MNDLDFWQICTAFSKAYFSNPSILILLVILVLAIGTSLRFRKIEKARGRTNTLFEKPPLSPKGDVGLR
jgi:hypothetical protein